MGVLLLAVAAAFLAFITTIIGAIGFLFDLIGFLIYGLYLLIEEWLKRRRNS